MTTTVVSWNIAKKHEPWRQLVEMGADVALLQEAGYPPADVADRVDTGSREHWDSHGWNSDWWKGRWPSLYDRWAKVVKLSDRVEVEWFRQVSPISEAAADEIAVSGIGTLAAARVTPNDGSEPFIAASMYAKWLRPHVSVDTKFFKVGYADASVHRILSDLSAFIGHTDPSTHRILAAGDLNMIYGATDSHPLAMPARESNVFDRMAALGLEFLGPQYPNGRQATPRPKGLPPDTRNVPTFYAPVDNPSKAWHQLDYAIASRGFHESVTVRAMNSIEEWGASDHCRLLIEVSG